jgi:hypothetical protein
MLLAANAAHPILLLWHEFRREIYRAGKPMKRVILVLIKDAAPAKGETRPTRTWNANYLEMLKEAITGKKTMVATMLATSQRANRAIVSFATE